MPRVYNCARIYVGGYVGGGTNENERWLECRYEVLQGLVKIRHLLPVRVQGTNSEGTMFKLDTRVLYPETENAVVKVTNGKRSFILRLVKSQSSHSTIFKMRL